MVLNGKFKNIFLRIKSGFKTGFFVSERNTEPFQSGTVANLYNFIHSLFTSHYKIIIKAGIQLGYIAT